MQPKPLPRPSWPARIGLTAILALALVAGLTLSAIVFAVALAFALPVGVWLWWQLRRVRRQFERQQQDYIEGEYEIETEYEVLEDQRRNPRGN